MVAFLLVSEMAVAGGVNTHEMVKFGHRPCLKKQIKSRVDIGTKITPVNRRPQSNPEFQTIADIVKTENNR
jgi:hypothetical protein